MALNAYLSLKGKRTGEIKGSVIQKGKENKILVIAASHQVSTPTNPASGAAIGRRVHSPFIITKELDKSSPLLYSALTTNDFITEWKLEFWGPQAKAATGVGTEVQKYTVRLTNVRITNIHFVMPNVKDPELVKYVEYEEVSFTYEKIEWLWVDGGITAADDLKSV
ncbi:type VI secretion system tube protein TssD [Pedobacter aquatilis]|uniref:type VI secretion system tube protein TssD n=1 Tax=Pedobacter aquatilis TaxID=351343 RepID=UPI00293109EE|nr:type VI secretion system tube protein TssD [Pedobacter aquatilis]